MSINAAYSCRGEADSPASPPRGRCRWPPGPPWPSPTRLASPAHGLGEPGSSVSTGLLIARRERSARPTVRPERPQPRQVPLRGGRARPAPHHRDRPPRLRRDAARPRGSQRRPGRDLLLRHVSASNSIRSARSWLRTRVVPDADKPTRWRYHVGLCVEVRDSPYELVHGRR